MIHDRHHGIESGESLRTDGGTDDDRTVPLRSLVKAHSLLDGADYNRLPDEAATRTWNALEELDNAILAGAGVLLTSEECALATDGGQEVDRVARIRHAFADVPTVEPPPEGHRDVVRDIYPPEVVPDSGPVPDPLYDLRETYPVFVPDWVIETVVHRVQRQVEDTGELLTRDEVWEIAVEHAQPQSRFYGAEDSAYPDVPLEEIVEERVGLGQSEAAEE